MSYQFPPELEALIKRQLETGEYEREDDVLFDALRSLQREKDDFAAVSEGIKDMEAGRVKPLRKFDREFRQKNGI